MTGKEPSTSDRRRPHRQRPIEDNDSQKLSNEVVTGQQGVATPAARLRWRRIGCVSANAAAEAVDLAAICLMVGGHTELAIAVRGASRGLRVLGRILGTCFPS